ncbi:MAG: amidohydrolase family protein [Phycisphaeraceae bacterium]|nr:amidohydrolase family protein [Phycisphaeraceae bacterium]
MCELNFFDSNCVIGKQVRWQPGQLESAEQLLAEMDHYGIAESMVLHAMGRQNHPIDGNREVLKVTANHPRLHPAWTALPAGVVDEQPEPELFLEQMRQNKVGALYLYPNQYKFTLDDWCIDDLLAPLADAGVPVVIDPVESTGGIAYGQDGTDWNALVKLCRRFPNLPVVVSERRIRRSQRTMFKAFEACDNLHIDISAPWLHRCIEFMTDKFGAKRLIFGSHWPDFGQHMTLAMLVHAEISDDDKQQIAGDNWRNMIKWCEPEHPTVTKTPPADEYVRFGRTGEKFEDMQFDDCHAHIGETSAHYYLNDTSTDQLIKLMDSFAINQTCIFNLTGIFCQSEPGNDIVTDAVKRYPERIVGFTLVNPHTGPEEMLAELERGYANGHRAVKLHPSYQGYPENGPNNIDVACQWVHDHQQLILNHYWGNHENMQRLVETYPNALFITGHTTTDYADIMKKHDNLYVCSCPLLDPRSCERVVDAIGADRFMFGSDMVDLPVAWGLGPILFAHISPKEKDLILGGNLRRLLKKYSLVTQ